MTDTTTQSRSRVSLMIARAKMIVPRLRGASAAATAPKDASESLATAIRNFAGDAQRVASWVESAAGAVELQLHHARAAGGLWVTAKGVEAFASDCAELGNALAWAEVTLRKIIHGAEVRTLANQTRTSKANKTSTKRAGLFAASVEEKLRAGKVTKQIIAEMQVECGDRKPDGVARSVQAILKRLRAE